MAIVTCPNCGKKNRVVAASEGVPRCGNCHELLAWLVDADDQTFEAELQTSLPVLIDLWAPWCGPCKWVSPAIEEIATTHKGQVKVIKVNVDEAPQVATRFEVRGIPTLVVLRDGQEVDRIAGAPSKQDLVTWLERHLAERAWDSFRGVQLGGQAALVTGATGGIGNAIARALHERGARLTLSGRRRDALDELAASLGDRTEVLVADLAERDAPVQLAEAAGAVDVLVANAALPASGRVEDFDHDQIDRALDVNLRAPIQLTRALLPGMLERGRGHVVFVSSLSGKTASPRSGIYSATKFGLRGFAAGLREDVEPCGIGVTVVFPGFVRDAGLFADSGVKLPPWVGTSTPEQVAEAVVRGIERERAEVDVAPLALRVGTRIAGLAPVTAARVQRRLGSERIADALADAQRGKR